MLKYCIAMVTALALAPTALLAQPKDQVPKFSGVYQISGQDTCSDWTSTNWATGVYTFASNGESFDLFEYDNGVGALQTEHVPNVPYTETATTLSFNGYTYALTTKIDRNGTVRSATLNGTYSSQQHTCRSQITLFR
jgi:hypothetical protein